jgi:hypothetical protein
MSLRLRKDQIDKASRILQGGLLLSSQWTLWSSNQMTRPTLLATTGAETVQELRKKSIFTWLNSFMFIVYSPGCLHLDVFTWVHSHGFIHVGKSTCVHSLGCIRFGVFTWGSFT